MESPKYLIIITLIDGQNFTVPDGLNDKIEASVFAEARFGNESILKSDPIKLTNSNPEFVTELAWQLDRRSLHQLRVERKAIKLQVFLQTRERVRNSRKSNDDSATNGFQSTDSNSTHKVELIGYTVIDIRSAQERGQPRFKWLPLLNPKFRKSSYNRPEVQLALTLSRIDEDGDDIEQPHPSTSTPNELKSQKKLTEFQSASCESENGSLNDSILYKTCLDFNTTSDQVKSDEIIVNDLNIKSKDGYFYIYDTRDLNKSTLEECDENYRLTVTIPFNSDLEILIKEPEKGYYFSVLLFGSLLRTEYFDELTSVETKDVQLNIRTTHSSILTTYFELNSNLVIKLHNNSGESLGIATIQLDQLCSMDMKRRSIEGIFALQPIIDNDIPSSVHPTIGVTIILERLSDETAGKVKTFSESHIEMAREHFGEDIDDYMFKTFNDTHQLTLEASNEGISMSKELEDDDIKQDDHHFCFTIDLKNFSYTSNQRVIPTLRELVVRYSYPFFGYKDSITTDASIPISSTNSIIVSGFCEFNFATTIDSLLTALEEIPLNLEILTCDQVKRVEVNDSNIESIVGTCNINLAQTLGLNEVNINQLKEKTLSLTVSSPIRGLNESEIGKLQIYLCLKDLGRPSLDFKNENLYNCANNEQKPVTLVPVAPESHLADKFISELKLDIDSWKNDCLNELSEEGKRRENERFKRLFQKLEAREIKRDQEFRKKMEELVGFEKRFKNSLTHIEALEKRLVNNLEHLKNKDVLLDTRLDTLDLEISRAISNIKLEYEKKLNPPSPKKFQRCFDDVHVEAKPRVPTKSSEANQTRRSSLKNPAPAGIPLPTRSSSLVRGPLDGSSIRLVKTRPIGVVTTVVNGISSRSRSNSTRLNLSKETQEKLASLRKQRAELLKRGCKPNDELIQEINSLIEKIAF